MKLAHKITAEALGTAMLLAAVVGSGIMGERLAGGNEALALLANSLATGAALIAILMTLGPVSGAHLNPVVSVAMVTRGDLAWRELPGYLSAQVIGAEWLRRRARPSGCGMLVLAHAANLTCSR